MVRVYLAGGLWMVIAAVATAIAAYSVRNFTIREGRAENNDAAGQVFTIVGGLYAVLVAFVLIGLFDAVDSARQTTYHEADSLAAAVWAGDSLPGPASTEMHRLAARYAAEVIDTEWPAMATDRPVGGQGWQTLNELHATIVNTTSTIAATTSNPDWQTDRRSEAANQLWAVYQDREQRLNDARGHVTTVMWFTLVVGGLLALGPSLLFGGPKIRAHIVLVSTLAATLSLLVFTIYQLQDPFAGGAAVGPDAFQAVLGRLR